MHRLVLLLLPLLVIMLPASALPAGETPPAAPATRPVWVFFADRPLAGAALDAALAEAAARLPETVRQRRLRAGAPAVTVGDLPVDPAALAAARGTGAGLRHAS
ncbi:MAG: hypothetical protein ABR506_01000, partial [Candidatus Krumholzibacteriia bacterium]